MLTTTTPIAQVHPCYEAQRCDWKRIRDAHKGQSWVKQQGAEYLPPTTGMGVWNGNCWQLSPEGAMDYAAYKLRALFSGDVAQMVRTAIGILWNKEATIELPAKMEYLRNHATSDGTTLMQLMREVNVEQILTGRCGLLVDLPTAVKGVLIKGPAKPYLTMYTAEQILNWDVGSRGLVPHRQLNLVVLDESENERQRDFSIKWQEKYLVLSLGTLDPEDVSGEYHWGRVRETSLVNTVLTRAFVYNKPLPFIPFTFINATNISYKVEQPPHIDLVDMVYSLYQNSADYEQMLHELAGESLVVEGGDEDKKYRVGAHSTICPTTGNKAYFIGLNGHGLPEMTKAVQNKKTEIERKSGQMIDTRSLQRESGESLKTRLAAQTATLASIAQACGWGMTRSLQQMAYMLGLDPKEVKVKPNTNFLNPELFAKTLVELMQFKNMGGPITDDDMIRMMQDRGVTTEDIETVKAILKKEPPALVTSGQPVGNPGGKPEPKVVEGETAKIAAKAKAANPTGTSARGKTRNPKSKSK